MAKNTRGHNGIGQTFELPVSIDKYHISLMSLSNFFLLNGCFQIAHQVESLEICSHRGGHEKTS
jgi:hypothetical protein